MNAYTCPLHGRFDLDATYDTVRCPTWVRTDPRPWHRRGPRQIYEMRCGLAAPCKEGE